MTTQGATAGFGADLRRARGSMTQQTLATAIGYHQSHISRIEKGKFPATLDIAQRCDEALNQRGALVRRFLVQNATTLPPAPDLVGRERAQDKIWAIFADVLTGEDPLRGLRVVISGPPAVGTSAFAQWAAGQIAGRFRDGALYLDLSVSTHGTGLVGPAAPRLPRDPYELLGDLLAEVGRFGVSVPQPIPSTLDKRVAAWQAALTELDHQSRQLLLVLDNAHSSAQVYPLLPAATHGTTVIIAGHARLDDALAGHWRERVELGLLEPPATATLVARELDKVGHPLREDDECTLALAQLCTGNPLNVTIMASVVGRLPPGASPDTMLATATAWREATDAGPCPIQARFKPIIDSLPSAERSLITLLGAWPMEEVALGVDAIASIAGMQPAAVTMPMLGLVEACLVRQVGDDAEVPRYVMDGVVAEQARATLAGQPELRAAAVARAVGYYRVYSTRMAEALAPWRTPWRIAIPDGVSRAIGVLRSATAPEVAMEWLKDERLALIAAAELAHAEGRFVDCAQLAMGLRGWLDLVADLEVWSRTHTLGLDAAIKAGDQGAEATLRIMLADYFRRSGRREDNPHAAQEYQLAKDHLRAAQDLWRSLTPEMLSEEFLALFGGRGHAATVIRRHLIWAILIDVAFLDDQHALTQALRPIARALGLLTPRDPVEGFLVHGRAANIRRQIHTPDSLKMAMDHVTVARKLLMQLGQPATVMRLDSWLWSIQAETQISMAHLGVDPAGRERAVMSLTIASTQAEQFGDMPAQQRLQRRLREVEAEIVRAGTHSASIPIS